MATLANTYDKVDLEFVATNLKSAITLGSNKRRANRAHPVDFLMNTVERGKVPGHNYIIQHPQVHAPTKARIGSHLIGHKFCSSTF
jgi:hypothetical protein